MTQRTAPRTLIIVSIAAILAVTVIVVVPLRWHRTEPTMPPASATPPVTVPTYEPTDPYGSPEPALPRGAAVAGAGGTTTGPAGLPLGYSHDETGAVNAATNYLTWMNSIKITDKKLADSLATATAADAATQQALIQSFDEVRPGMSELTADQPEPARGAYAVASFDSGQALIYIWYPEVTTDRSGATTNLWAIEAIALNWSNGDWKLQDGLIAKSGGAAVDPSDPSGNPSAQEKHSILSRTPADPGEITDTAHQSWFEYDNAPH